MNKIMKNSNLTCNVNYKMRSMPRLRFSRGILFLNVASILVCLFSMFFARREISYIFVLVAYKVLMEIFGAKITHLSKRPGLLIANVIMFLRYNLSVLIYYVSGAFSRFGVSEHKFFLATILMIYEMFVIFLAISFFYKKKQDKGIIVKRKYEFNSQKKQAILVIAVLLIVVCSLFDKSLRPNWGLLVGNSRFETVKDVSGAWGILWQTACLTIYLIAVFDCYFKYVNTKNRKYVYCTVLFSIVYIFYIYISL